MTSGSVGNRKENIPVTDLSSHELRQRYEELKERLRMARENFEFDYAEMLREEMQEVKGQLRRSGVA